jgi:hypothetical protein
MTTKDNLEEKLEELSQAIGSDESLVENVMSSIDAKPIAEPNRTDKSKNKLLLRRFVMNRFTKLAAAAAIIIAVVLSITFLDKSVTPAYAIEQTIEASRDLRFLYFEYFGRSDDKPIKECWIEFEPNGQPKNVRTNLHAHWQIVHVWKEGKTQTWRKKENTLRTYEDEAFTAKILKLVRDCDPRTAVESLYERELKGEVKIEIEQPEDKKKPIVIKGTFLPGKYLLDNPTLPSFRDVLYVDQATKLVTAIEVYELKDGEYQYNGVWNCYKHDQPFEARIFDLEDEAPADAKRLTNIY